MTHTSITHAITKGDDGNLSIDQAGGTNLPGEDGTATVSVTLDSSVAPATYGPYTITSTGTGKDGSTQTGTFEFTATVNAVVTTGPGETTISSGDNSVLFSDSDLNDIPNSNPLEVDFYNETDYQSWKGAGNWINPNNPGEFYTATQSSEHTVQRYIDGWHIHSGLNSGGAAGALVSRAYFTPKVTLVKVGNTDVNHILCDTSTHKSSPYIGDGITHNILGDESHTTYPTPFNLDDSPSTPWSQSGYQNTSNGFLTETGFTHIVSSNESTGIQLVEGVNSGIDIDTYSIQTSNDVATESAARAFSGLGSNDFVLKIEPEYMVMHHYVSDDDDNYFYATYYGNTLTQLSGTLATGYTFGTDTYKPVS
jgi:hypothetical protein